MSAGRRLARHQSRCTAGRAPGGVTLAGDSWGDPNGPLVLLQHGGGQTRHAWKGAGDTLGAAGYHAVAFDARGHGDSDWAPDGVYGQDLMVEDLTCLVAALDSKRPVLVGASMGGGTSLVAVGEDHVDATALVLVDIAPRIELDGVKKIQAFMSQKPEGFASLDEVAAAISATSPTAPGPATSTAWPRTSASATTAGTTGTGTRGSAPATATCASARPGWSRAPATSPSPRCSCEAGSPTSSARTGRRASSPCARTASTSTSPVPPTWWPVTATTSSPPPSSSSSAAPCPSRRP